MPFLGRIPLDPQAVLAGGAGRSLPPAEDHVNTAAGALNVNVRTIQGLMDLICE